MEASFGFHHSAALCTQRQFGASHRSVEAVLPIATPNHRGGVKAMLLQEQQLQQQQQSQQQQYVGTCVQLCFPQGGVVCSCVSRRVGWLRVIAFVHVCVVLSIRSEQHSLAPATPVAELAASCSHHRAAVVMCAFACVHGRSWRCIYGKAQQVVLAWQRQRQHCTQQQNSFSTAQRRSVLFRRNRQDVRSAATAECSF